MYSLSQLEKQQVGLRLPRYLVEQLDELATSYSLNRTDLIFEAVRSYIEQQKAEQLYAEFKNAAQDISAIQNNKAVAVNRLDSLIDELESTHSADF
ncbi:MAG: ribbon-helix-helix domain-containing protein [Venatoribacter sp.]